MIMFCIFVGADAQGKVHPPFLAKGMKKKRVCRAANNEKHITCLRVTEIF